MGPGLIWIKKNWKIVQKQSFASVQFVPICPLWCSNIKSKISVGRHAVSRYHQLKKFFIAGDHDPDYAICSVHGGCYIISSVGIEYSCGMSVM